MFDGPSDLVVFPHSTVGSVTDFVRKRLRQFAIPAPQSGVELGHVEVRPLEGAETVAQYVAFAASVRSRSSTLEAIERIGRQLGGATVSQKSIRVIAAPLLGAGAGRLPSEKVVSSLRDGFLATCSRDATLNIFVRWEDLYAQLVRQFKRRQVRPDEGTSPRAALPGSRDAGGPRTSGTLVQPRVLISYTRTNSEHQQWVEELGTHLRSNGIEARLDVWHLRLGMELAQWMSNELDLADRVLLICNEEYIHRADGRHGGVGWETRLVLADLLSAPLVDKYIPIRLTDRAELPLYYRALFSLDWPPTSAQDGSLRERLVRELLRVSNEPPLGRRPVSVRRPVFVV
jgi:hypothetical protein